MNKTKPKTLKELLDTFHAKLASAESHEGAANKDRIEAAKALLKLQHRIEAGEAGNVSWWDWFKQNSSRSRRDAERLLRIAKAEDPEAALEETRWKAQEGMARVRSRRATNNGDVSRKPTDEELAREARVDAYIEKWTQREIEERLQTKNRQVADYLDSIKVFDKATDDALTALRKFSPEAKPFTIRRLRTIQEKLTAMQLHVGKMIAALGESSDRNQAASPEHVNGATNGEAAA